MSLSGTMRALAAAVTVTAAAASLTACVSRAPSQPASAGNGSATVSAAALAGVTLHVGDQKGTGTQALLQAAGQLTGLPYKIDFSTFTSGPPEIEAANAGKIDFTVTGNTPPIFGAAAGAQIKVVSAYANQGKGDQILIPSDSTITSVAQLKGKRVAVGKGSSAHGNLLLQLQKAGLTLQDITPVYLQPADALAAFNSHAVDAWAIWEPYTAQAQIDSHAKTLVTAEGTSTKYDFGVASVGALKDAAKNTAIRDLVVRIARATDWAEANIGVWADRYAAETGLSPAITHRSEAINLHLPILLSDQVSAAEQQLADLFAQTKQFDTAPHFADWVDTRYNTDVAPFVGK